MRSRHAPGCHHPRTRVIQYSRDSSDSTEKPRRTGYPACAGYDTAVDARNVPVARSGDQMPVAGGVDGADGLVECDLGAVQLPRGQHVGSGVLEQDVRLVVAVDVLQAGKAVGGDADLGARHDLQAVHLPHRDAMRDAVGEDDVRLAVGVDVADLGEMPAAG